MDYTTEKVMGLLRYNSDKELERLYTKYRLLSMHQAFFTETQVLTPIRKIGIIKLLREIEKERLTPPVAVTETIEQEGTQCLNGDESLETAINHFRKHECFPKCFYPSANAHSILKFHKDEELLRLYQMIHLRGIYRGIYGVEPQKKFKTKMGIIKAMRTRIEEEESTTAELNK